MRKQTDIASNLRRAICQGRYQPGARLPTVRALTASTGAGLPTVHRALRVLVEQGFIVTGGRHGTHVAEHPPQRCRFGLVLPEAPGPDGRYRHRVPQALAEAAAAIGRPDRHIAIHHGLNQHPELPGHRQLADELAAGMLAGLLVVDLDRIDTWLMPALSGVPIIAAPKTGRPIDGWLNLDQHRIVCQAIDEATAAGRRRLAFIGEANEITLHYLSTLRHGAAKRGLALPPCRIHAASIACPAWAAHAVEASWDPTSGEPPDALIILDDNLVDAAVAGLRALGPRAADTLLIHLANFPAPPAAWRPLIRIGWDQSAVLATALEFLATRRPHPAELVEISAPVQTERLS